MKRMLKCSVGLVAGLLVANTSLAREGDLPQVVEVHRQSSQVDVYAIEKVEITQQQVAYNNPVALMTLTLEVEGNICGRDPESLTFLTSRNAKGTFDLDITVSSKYTPSPETLRACLTYSSRSTLILPVELSGYDASDNQIVYNVASLGKSIVVKMSTDGQFSATVR
jgi:hypothetical protein